MAYTLLCNKSYLVKFELWGIWFRVLFLFMLTKEAVVSESERCVLFIYLLTLYPVILFLLLCSAVYKTVNLPCIKKG